MKEIKKPSFYFIYCLIVPLEISKRIFFERVMNDSRPGSIVYSALLKILHPTGSEIPLKSSSGLI